MRKKKNFPTKKPLKWPPPGFEKQGVLFAKTATPKELGIAGTENKYIQSVTLNGKPLERLWFSHRELMEGGTLTLRMGYKPNKLLGSRPQDLPPSSLNLDPATLQ